MKILWVTNILIGLHREMMGKDPNRVTGGGWLSAAYVSSLQNKVFELHIVTVDNVSMMEIGQKDGNYFYILPDGGKILYDIDNLSNVKNWNDLREKVKPDLVVIWGTESRHAYLAMKCFVGIPSVIYMQGVLRSIVSHYYDGVPFKYQYWTLRDFYDKASRNSTINKYKAQACLEYEMLRMAKAVVVENDWCEDMCKNANSELRVFRNLLPIMDCFFKCNWSINKMERHSIFTNAGGYPIKGHHILFKSLGIVKGVYPDFKCYIPGIKLSEFDSFTRKSGYVMYLHHLINDAKIKDNLIYTGYLSSEEIVEQILRSNVYVMPSIVENHSSSLIESMIVGAPCVSSLVGGTASVVVPNSNALIYNSLDAESLAGCIIRLFENDRLAESISKKTSVLRNTRNTNFGNEMLNIYKEILLGENESKQ